MEQLCLVLVSYGTTPRQCLPFYVISMVTPRREPPKRLHTKSLQNTEGKYYSLPFSKECKAQITHVWKKRGLIIYQYWITCIVYLKAHKILMMYINMCLNVSGSHDTERSISSRIMLSLFTIVIPAAST